MNEIPLKKSVIMAIFISMLIILSGCRNETPSFPQPTPTVGFGHVVQYSIYSADGYGTWNWSTPDGMLYGFFSPGVTITSDIYTFPSGKCTELRGTETSGLGRVKTYLYYNGVTGTSTSNPYGSVVTYWCF